MECDSAFIFHMCILWGKTFSLVQRSRSSIEFTIFKKIAFVVTFCASQTHLVYGEEVGCK